MPENLSPGLRQRLKMEIAERGISASFAFAVIGVTALLFPFDFSPSAPMRLAAGIAVMASLVRLFKSRRCVRARQVTGVDYRIMGAAIATNSAAWGIFFGLGQWEAASRGDSYLISMLVIVGFCSASVISLSASKVYSQIFVAANLGGQIAILAYLKFTGLKAVNGTLLIVMPIYLIYLFREAYLLRRQMIARHRSQLRLEAANASLKLSRQELVEQTARTVHASRLASLGEMAGGIAHEVNNPLAIIDLSIESFKILHAKAHGPMNEAAAHVLDRAQKAVYRISKIVKGLKNFSRAGDADPFEEVAVQQIIDDTLGLCAEKLKAHAVDLSVEADNSISLRCRPIEVAQILINLLNNAFDAVAELPEEERMISIKVARSEGRAQLIVANGGPSIPAPVAEKLFQPFFTTKPPGAGTGLGLSVSHAIAQKHGGDLRLVHPANRTTFVLEIPLAQNPPQAPVTK